MDGGIDDKNIMQKFCRVRNRVERFQGDFLLPMLWPSFGGLYIHNYTGGYQSWSGAAELYGAGSVG